MLSLSQDLPNRQKSRAVRLLFLAAASFVTAAVITGCSEKTTRSAFAPTSVIGGAGGGQVQFHRTDATVTASPGVPLSRQGGPRPGTKQRKAEWDALTETEKAARKAEMERRKAEWDALSETEKAAKRAEMGGPRPGGFGGPRPGRGRHGGSPPESEDDVAEPAEGEVAGAEEL